MVCIFEMFYIKLAKFYYILFKYFMLKIYFNFRNTKTFHEHKLFFQKITYDKKLHLAKFKTIHHENTKALWGISHKFIVTISYIWPSLDFSS